MALPIVCLAHSPQHSCPLFYVELLEQSCYMEEKTFLLMHEKCTNATAQGKFPSLELC